MKRNGRLGWDGMVIDGEPFFLLGEVRRSDRQLSRLIHGHTGHSHRLPLQIWGKEGEKKIKMHQQILQGCGKSLIKLTIPI